jgi:hypothetical protein
VVKSEINTSCPQLKVVTQQFDQGELDETKFANVFETAFSKNNLSKDNFQQAVTLTAIEKQIHCLLSLQN